MPQSYATASDLANLTIGPEPTTEQLQALLDAAYIKLRAKVPGLDTRVTNGLLDREAVRLVLVEMVQEVTRNPSGQRSGSETAGPFARSWSWDQAAASGRLRVTDEHLATLGISSATAYTATSPFTAAWGC